ncbi:MAG: hypothetical protein AAGE94_01595, partial [Acidobacteriota bacterium]
FFLAFEPLFDGFKGRAEEVEALLAAPGTRFALVAGPGEARLPDTLFFARRLREAGCHLGPIVVNRVHPRFGPTNPEADDARWAAGIELFGWLGERHQRGLDALRQLVDEEQTLAALPLEAAEPTDLDSLRELGHQLLAELEHLPASDSKLAP